MPVKWWWYRQILGGIVGVVCFSGCGDPCYRLARRLCGCIQQEEEQRSCLQQVHIQSRGRLRGDGGRCAAALGTCTCEGLRRGGFSSCGLSYE